MSDGFVPVAKASELAPGQIKWVAVEGERVVLANVEGSFYALRDVCGHKNAPLSRGRLVGCLIECPLHFAQFDMRTGRLVSGPVSADVPVYEVRVDGDTILARGAPCARQIRARRHMIAIEDRLAIEDLFVRYTTALDNGEVETVVGCFTPDAVLESPAIGKIAGHDAIRAFAGRFAALSRDGTQFRHMITNLAVTGDGERARATCYLLVLITRDGASRPLPPGRYECDLIKEDGAWRFRRRIVFHDHAHTLDGLAP